MPLSNLGLALWCLHDAYRYLVLAGSHRRPGMDAALEAVLAAAMLAAAVLSLRRPAARLKGHGAWTWVVVIISCLWPVARTLPPAAGPPGDPTVVLLVRLIAAGSLLAATLTLGQSFAVFPAVRRIVSAGPYRVVRHPFFASYLLFDLPGWATAASPWHAGVLWMLEAALLAERARLEERCLEEDPAYRDYRQRVRYRFIPGLV